MRYWMTKKERHEENKSVGSSADSKIGSNISGRPVRNAAASSSFSQRNENKKTSTDNSTEKGVDVVKLRRTAAAQQLNAQMEAKRREAERHSYKANDLILRGNYTLDSLSAKQRQEVINGTKEQLDDKKVTSKDQIGAIKDVVPIVGAAASGNTAKLMAYTSALAVDKAMESHKKKLKAQNFELRKANITYTKRMEELKKEGTDKLSDEYLSLSHKLGKGTITEEESTRLTEIISSKGDDIAEFLVTKDEIAKNEKLLKGTKKDQGYLQSATKVLTYARTVKQAVDSSEDPGDAAMTAAGAIPMHFAQNAARDTFEDLMNKEIYLTKKGKAKAEKKLEDEAKESFRKTVYKTNTDIIEKTDQKKAQIKSDYAKRQAKGKQLKARQEAAAEKLRAQKAIYLKANRYKNAYAGGKAAAAGKSIAASGGSAVIAAGGVVALVIMFGIVVPLILSALFSWMNPHTETYYDDDQKKFVSLNLREEKEILEGYIKHIRDYFDIKQIDILKEVEFKYGGFDPDDYRYNEFGTDRDESYYTPVTYDGIKKIKTTTSRYMGPDAPRQYETNNSEEDYSVGIYTIRYLAYAEDGDGYLYYVSGSGEYDFMEIQMDRNIDLNEYYTREGYTGEVFTFEPSVFFLGDDIADMNVKKKNSSGVTVWEKPAKDVLIDLSEPSVADSLLPGGGTTTSGDEYNSVTTTVEYTNGVINQIEKQYEPGVGGSASVARTDLNIYNLNEYGNKWIKLADDVDFESIIAMAAIKKFQYIESDTFDDTDFTYEITEEDLEQVIDGLYHVEIQKHIGGVCADQNCNRYLTEDGWVYYCDRPAEHVHLRGQVINYTNYGFDFLFNRVLDFTTPTYENDKELFDIYRQYIYDTLGTSTHLDDFENDRSAQMRLYRKYLLDGGYYLLESPDNITIDEPHLGNWTLKSIFQYTGEGVWSGEYYGLPENVDIYKLECNIMINVSWEPYNYEDGVGNVPEILGYRIYSIKNDGTKRCIGDVTGADTTSCEVMLSPLGNANYVQMQNRESGCLEYWTTPTLSGDNLQFLKMPHRTRMGALGIVVVAYNNDGESEIDIERAARTRETSPEQIEGMYTPQPVPAS